MIWTVVLRLVLAAGMLVAAAAKAARPKQSRRALEIYGLTGEGAQRAVLPILIGVEVALTVSLAAGLQAAEWVGLGLVLAGAVSAAALLVRGRGGEPCPCYGGSTRIGPAGVVRDLLLAAGFAALIAAPPYEPTGDELIVIGLGAALVLIMGLALAVAALAREIGMLRMRVGPSAALEIPEEGPPLGARSPLATRFDAIDAEVLLAVFFSPACRVCEALRPTVESIRGSDRVEIEIFAEGEDSAPWAEAGVPGSPYAVAMDAGGLVGAKGTFNNLAQLEGLVATALSRFGEGPTVAHTDLDPA